MKKRLNLKLHSSIALWLMLTTNLGSTTAFATADLNITDPEILDRLSDSRLAFASQIGAVGENAETLYKNSLYRSLVDQIDADLISQEAMIKKSTPKLFEKVERFKIDWLRSPRLSFQLAAVVNRFDRRGLEATPCGEVRLIYRAKYRSVLPNEAPFERLPMSVMLVYSAANIMRHTKCTDIGKEMMMQPKDTPEKFAENYLRTNKLGSSLGKGSPSFIRAEINLQISRWPSTKDIRFSDQSHYLMRVLVRDAKNTGLVPVPLENTPDVERLMNSESDLIELRHWLLKPSTEASAAVGSIQIPTRFLATKEVSVSPMGLARLANRPFSALFTTGDGFSVDYLRRLDSLSCNGCHQSKSLAGFHALGFDSAIKDIGFSLRWPFSAYFEGVQSWRKQDFAAALEGSPSPYFPSTERGSLGMSGDTCSLDSSLTAWDCKAGFRCDAIHSGEADKRFGQCVTIDPTIAGKPCDTGHISTNILSIKDEYANTVVEDCGEDAVCAPSRAGFPNGFCSTSCRKKGKNICAAVPSLGPFSKCLDTTHQFRSCARQFNYVVDMPRCSTNSDCRRDYACIAAISGQGFCAPPYFVPELTLGHHQP